MSRAKTPLYHRHDPIRDHPDPPRIETRPVRTSLMTNTDYARHAELVRVARERGAVAQAGDIAVYPDIGAYPKTKKEPPEDRWDRKNQHLSIPKNKGGCKMLTNRLTQHRAARGWSMSELAKRSGVSIATIRNIESDRFPIEGKRQPTLRALADALDLPVSRVFPEREENPHD